MLNTEVDLTGINLWCFCSFLIKVSLGNKSYMVVMSACLSGRHEAVFIIANFKKVQVRVLKNTEFL